MAATVTRLPVAKKRGRKVTKGPKALVTVMDSRIDECGQWIDWYDEEMAKLRRLAKERLARSIEDNAQQEAWIDLSRNVARWPDWARVRSPELVNLLRKGGEDEEPTVTPERQRFLEEVRLRVDQIIEEATAKGGDHG